MRDYYLKNLGVGEIWLQRQTTLSSSPVLLESAASGDDNVEVVAAPSSIALMASVPTIDDKQLTPWQKMQTELQQCQACSLCARFGKGALGSGDTTASILVIADWSVSDKLAQLEPVLQQSEKLMFNMLGALLADGAQASTKLSVYRTSVLKAQLSESSQMPFDEAASDATRLCMNFLHRQIKLVQPRILLVFGEHLGRILLGVDAASEIKMRQEQHAYQGIPVIVTHDAHFVLAHPESKFDVWQDICRVKRL